MSKSERMSKVEIPAWWLAKAIPLLESPSVKHREIARAASIHAGRRNAWDASAISKFKEGIGQTVALTNAISAVLQIPPPFFTAPTERGASEMLMIVRREQALSVADGVATAAIRDGVVDVERAHGASSPDVPRGGPGERTRRVRVRRT